MLGASFLHDLDDGQKVQGKGVKKVLDCDAENHEWIKMLVQRCSKSGSSSLKHNRSQRSQSSRIDKSETSSGAASC